MARPLVGSGGLIPEKSLGDGHCPTQDPLSEDADKVVDPRDAKVANYTVQ